VEELTQLFNYQVYSVISKPFTYEKIKTLGKQAVEQIQWQRTNERLARVGLMAAEMIHEINNPLALVDLGLENLEKKYTQEKIIQTMKKGILRVNSIITRTKNKVRGDDSRDYGIFVVRDAIREAEEEFSRKASQAGVIVEVLGDQNDTLFGDKDDIKRVIVNLVNNSIDAISNLSEKWIKISIKSGPLGVSLNVTDSGNGIPEELRRKIFTTMFTTKGKFGTGLGLGLCRRIANEHGGNLYLVADAKNTTFALLLPKKTLSGITKLNSEQSG
jgi:signal transduction histidine kinase